MKCVWKSFHAESKENRPRKTERIRSLVSTNFKIQHLQCYARACWHIFSFFLLIPILNFQTQSLWFSVNRRTTKQFLCDLFFCFFPFISPNSIMHFKMVFRWWCGVYVFVLFGAVIWANFYFSIPTTHNIHWTPTIVLPNRISFQNRHSKLILCAWYFLSVQNSAMRSHVIAYEILSTFEMRWTNLLNKPSFISFTPHSHNLFITFYFILIRKWSS